MCGAGYEEQLNGRGAKINRFPTWIVSGSAGHLLFGTVA
jgi:hypothetical protein